MRLQVVVQHHPSRVHLLPALLAALPGAQVIADPDPANRRRNAWRSYEACLRALEEGTDWLLICQDDILPCRDFAEAAPVVIAAHAALRPAAPLALFTPGAGSMRRRVLAACAAGERWAALDPLTWTPVVCLAWPAVLAAQVLAFAEERKWPPTATSDDSNVAEAFRTLGVQAWAAVPSLCEHEDKEPSAVGKAHFHGRNPSRVAACWLGSDLAALDLDWC